MHDGPTLAPRERARRPDIQGLRAVAVLLVVVFHAGAPVSGGFTGVDVFFVISGFVITGSLLPELVESGRISFARFYTRRVKRLGPALALMVTVVGLVGILAGPAATQRQAALTGAAASLFAANGYLYHLAQGYFDTSTSLNPFLNLWTLAAEEQFYLAFPALLFASWWLGRRWWRRGRAAAVAAISLAAVGSLALALVFAASAYPRHQRFAFYSSPTRAWEFAAGALLALLAPQVARLPAVAGWVLGWAGLTLVGVGAFSIHGTAHFPGPSALWPVGGACALLAAGTVSQSGASTVLGLRPVTWIGDLSYSWYLWHWPLIVLATASWPGAGWAAPVAAGASILPAWLSYRYVENPIRFSRRISGRRVVAVGATCVAVPLVACGAMLAAHRLLRSSGPVEQWAQSQALHADVLRGCDDAEPLPPGQSADCTWTTSHAKGLIVLAGDSNAGQFTEPVTVAGNQAGYNVTVATRSDCPFADVRLLEIPATAGQANCRRFYLATVARLVALKPTLVILASRAPHYLAEPFVGLAAEPDGRATFGQPGKAAIWEAGLRATIGQLNGAGIPVVVVHAVPTIRSSTHDCAVFRILAKTCDASVSRAAALRDLQAGDRAEQAAVAASSLATTLDFVPALCGTGSCSSQQGATIMYRDDEHLSVAGALTLAPEFHTAIVKRAR